MSASVASAEKAYAALGVPPPRRTFLDRQMLSTTPRAASSTGRHTGENVAGSDSLDPTKAALLAAHKVELEDMLQEAVALLRNVYRSKQIFGEHLRFVDPSFGGDAVHEFQLMTPPVMDPAYALTDARIKVPTAAAVSGVSRGGAGGGGGGHNEDDDGGSEDALHGKLRTAEELIKKIYRRNQELEVQNKYLTAQITHHERLSGLGRTGSHNLCFVDGHVPNDHPLYAPKLRRRCRSGPPTRTLLRSAVGGYGLTFPPQGGAGVDGGDDEAPKPDPLPVQQLKRRVHQLTEALVTVQHENEQLVAEKSGHLSMRDALLRSYLAQRDQQIAALHESLQELLSKVANPMRLARARQPAPGVSPAVATSNVLRDVNQRLAAQVASLTADIVGETEAALPARAAAAAVPPGSPHRRPGSSGGGGLESVRPHPPGSRAANAANTAVPSASPSPGAQGGQTGEASGLGMKRRELARRVRAMVDTLPTGKRKQLLLVMFELKQLFESLAASNRALLQGLEEHKSAANGEAVKLKLQVAVLADQLRALGVQDEETDQLLHGASSRAAAGGGRRSVVDP